SYPARARRDQGCTRHRATRVPRYQRCALEHGPGYPPENRDTRDSNGYGSGNSSAMIGHNRRRELTSRSDPVLAAHELATPPLRAWLAAVTSHARYGTPPLPEVEALGDVADQAWREFMKVAEDM